MLFCSIETELLRVNDHQIGFLVSNDMNENDESAPATATLETWLLVKYFQFYCRRGLFLFHEIFLIKKHRSLLKRM